MIAYDPGLITGWAMGDFTDSEPLSLVLAGTSTYEQMCSLQAYTGIHAEHVVIEEFTLRDNSFRADLRGVRVEGMIELMFRASTLGMGATLVWRPPSKKPQVPDQVLKDHGLWQTGRDVDWEDGRDANDAIIHLLGYVAFDLKHRPTLERYFK